MKTINPERTRCPYDVGDVLITASSAQPSTRWPGTSWTQIKDIFPLAAGDTYKAGSTGGEAQHTLTVDELAWHNHTPVTVHTVANWTSVSPGNMYGSLARGPANQGDNEWKEDQTGIAAAGGSQPHNNMPPYKAFYMWQRTA